MMQCLLQDLRLEGHNPCTIVTLRFVVENGQKTIWGIV
jgi:hypothetical protein